MTARLQRLSLPSDAVRMTPGAMMYLTAIPEPAEVPNLTLTYHSTNPWVASVDGTDGDRPFGGDRYGERFGERAYRQMPCDSDARRHVVPFCPFRAAEFAVAPVGREHDAVCNENAREHGPRG